MQNNQTSNKMNKSSFSILFLLDIFFICISNAIPKAPYTLPRPDPQPTHSHFLALLSPVLGHMIFIRPRASPPIDGQLGHPLQHM